MATITNNDYVRICPTCGTHNAPQVMRCACGAMIAGVDLVRPGLAAAPAARGTSTTRADAGGTHAAGAHAVNPNVAQADVTHAGQLLCAYEDCGQANPPGSSICLYCNRPLAAAAGAGTGVRASPSNADSGTGGLLNLPAALKSRYRVQQAFAAGGAEAELCLVAPLQGGAPLVAKIYRKGILPKADVLERVSRVDERYRVRFIEQGVSEGFAYEVMEYCAAGSLREWLNAGAPPLPAFRVLAENLAACVAAVHAVGLLHRDLKPANVLVRAREPLQLVLTDFGIASVLDATRRFTGGARTLAYASPESLSGLIDRKSDYWALGMILLEALLGHHPFVGLSDPVIMHHLTTRGVDLSAVHDHDARKLLRGLLLRDPKARWSQAEVARWLAGDATLPEAVEQGVAASFDRPYRLAGEMCNTPQELAAALTRHWSKGAADISNGQLLSWFRDVQKDQDTVRLLLEMQHETRLHIDVQLLRLILHLAPGLPPVWRGDSVELRAILIKASQALKGDEQAERWLDGLYEHGVLEIHAAAGDPEAAVLVERWTGQAARFEKAWTARLAFLKQQQRARQPNRVVDYDEAVFGSAQSRPAPLSLHARFLAMAYDPSWSEKLRKRLVVELAPVTVHCPWLGQELGDPLKMAPADLLVAEALLPDLRKAAEQQEQAEQDKRVAAEDESKILRDEYRAILESLRGHLDAWWFPEESCDDIEANIVQHAALLEGLRARGEAGAAWVELSRQVARLEPAMHQLSDLLARLAQRRAANALWLNWGVGLAYLVLIILLPRSFGVGAKYVLVCFGLAVVAWRLLPGWQITGQLRELGRGLPTLPRSAE